MTHDENTIAILRKLLENSPFFSIDVLHKLSLSEEVLFIYNRSINEKALLISMADNDNVSAIHFLDRKLEVLGRFE